MVKYGSVTVFTVILGVFSCTAGVKVTVYYESLCGDSIRFITRQLYPRWNEISDYVDLDLVPYGKAIHNLENMQYKFDCQHGQAECRGNKYQACLLDQKKGKNVDVPLISCIMNSKNPASLKLVNECAKKFHYDEDKFNQCIKTIKADELLAQYGDQTWKLDPAISFVPTIVFDDKFNETETKRSQTEFLGVLCSKITGTKPAVCNGRELLQLPEWDY